MSHPWMVSNWNSRLDMSRILSLITLYVLLLSNSSHLFIFSYILATGLENGDILLYQSELSDASKWTCLHAVEK